MGFNLYPAQVAQEKTRRQTEMPKDRGLVSVGCVFKVEKGERSSGSIENATTQWGCQVYPVYVADS